ncbi:hypothetical protein WG915_03655 [Corynebacterium sp. H128]|uniref:hypothetical protein n=1 Tax=unclassified Corynebacterium TaxID=2624378 RepID=UPI0030A5CF7D
MTDVQQRREPVTVVLREASERSTSASTSTSREQPQPASHAPQSRLSATGSEDRWLDVHGAAEYSRTISTRLKDSISLPALWSRRIRTFANTTIGMMTLITLVLTVALLAAGISMSRSTESRQSELGTLVNNSEPRSATAQDLFTSLSLADTIATTGFVQAGVELPSTRDRYQRAIQRSAAAATQTAAGLEQGPTRELELITQIQTQLPSYTALVETARTNNRLGNPVGVAYMSEASSLMRSSILPAASELLDISNSKVNHQQRELAQPQWIPISGLVAALVLLTISQRWLANHTRRRLNKGFLTATAFMLTALLWVAAANGMTWYSGAKGYNEAAAPLGALTNARVLAQQARTAETMALVRRETSAESIEDFGMVMGSVRNAMQEYQQSDLASREANSKDAEDIINALNDWEATHQKLRRALDNGAYNDAIGIAFHSHESNGPNSDGTTAASFDAVDSGLARLMNDARLSLRSYLDSGLMATRWVSTLVLVLSIASVAAIWLGIRPRLQEYL